jgi:hypothetical protein
MTSMDIAGTVILCVLGLGLFGLIAFSLWLDRPR